MLKALGSDLKKELQYCREMIEEHPKGGNHTAGIIGCLPSAYREMLNLNFLMKIQEEVPGISPSGTGGGGTNNAEKISQFFTQLR